MTPRETWILENLVPGLMRSAAEREGASLRPEEAFRLFRDADPSANGSATSWLVDTYGRGGFLLEDLEGGPLSKAADTLTAFARHRRALAPVDRSLNRYPTLSDLWNAVAPFETARLAADEAALLASATGQERRRLERDKARRESVILREDGEATVSIPLTRFAATWWGRGTRWCTAAESNNMFADYGDAPLVVVTLPGGERVQLYASESAVYLMDESDAPVAKDAVAWNWSVLGPLLEWAWERNPRAITFMPDRHVTAAMWSEAVERNPALVLAVPRLWMSEDLQLRAIERNPANFRWPYTARSIMSLEETAVHHPWMTERVVELAVRLDGANLVKLPKAMRTPELCAIALENSPLALIHVPEERKTSAMCRDAVARDPGAISSVPPALLTEEMCWSVLHAGASFVTFIPEEGLTTAMVRYVIAQEPLLVARMWQRRMEELTEDDLVAAISAKPQIIRSVRAGDLSSSLFDRVFDANPMSLLHMPPRHVTERMVLGFLAGGHHRIATTEPYEVTKNLSLTGAFRLQGRLATDEFIDRVMREWPDALELVPPGRQTPEMVRASVAACPAMLAHANSHHLTAETCRAALEADPLLGFHVPARYREELGLPPLDLVTTPHSDEAPARTAMSRPERALGWTMADVDGLRAAMGMEGAPESMPVSGPSP